ncbi:D-isomer specific 2-hydroxyacid dehydrogenase NAD-binding protein [Arcobacter nitrofigilis DSM 7299]|uniref:D-isomer specific 2-hydroxyacid dehydrogenase NAD-binding protein n=1 Tax=Arcobacter nitrofigilis (strain ATCC 33309 / DSM 7299 / CCUG 15893 / LMG 7604 / NCTC 12251 / CI) TaxID=572480 RepID=D5V427_ARCNC|nr:D-2-hydroxyacid dehydrogenase family protein [Arcobacter nitrofigilis]ADG92855.1 D-isomer specific 2-hydroxyacid dehydrogenase NAD-binding protein [Arcobacter nitrofigilis DSM 7299]
MKIAILDDYQDVVKNLDCFKILANYEVKIFNNTYTNSDELASKLVDFDALVLIRERTVITEELLSKLPKLKLISQTGKISNHINLDLCKKYNVQIAEGIGSPIAPSELCWSLIMAASRNIPEYVSNLSQNIWQQSGNLGLGRTLDGLTLGIWGYGKIGQKIAKYANAFGMNVLVLGREPSQILAKEHGFEATSSKEKFFKESDIITLHLRLNEATKECVTKADLQLMKPDSLFVNTSRAQLVQSGALYEEMLKNPSKRAAIDVYENEPATKENEPLLSLENVLCSPHLGYVEKNSYELYFKIAFENIVAFAKGEAQNLAK